MATEPIEWARFAHPYRNSVGSCGNNAGGENVRMGIVLNKFMAAGFRKASIVGATTILLSFAGSANAYDESSRELPPLEDLINFEVTSVSKKAESLNNASAAIYVITGDDIRRSGVRSIPEALRMAPGITVSQLTGNLWSISSRGFNNEFQDSLLVLMDGRSMYTPLFGGVYWDVQDTLLEDIDRIEVIRGPGGTLWGANAFSGVINIVTKSADKTQGGYVQAGAGNIEHAFTSIRYGGKAGDNLSYRVYAKGYWRDPNITRFPNPPIDEPRADDRTTQTRGGFRTDWTASERDHVTFQGDYYEGRVYDLGSGTDPLTLSTVYSHLRDDVRGGNAIVNWDRAVSTDEDLSLRAYYDYTDRKGGASNTDAENHILDVEFQHRRPLIGPSEIIWGLGYRRNINDYYGNPQDLTFPHIRRTDDLFTGFAQVSFPIFVENLQGILGTKLERNDYTGWEVQPTARFNWAVTETQTIWGAVSRAVSTPSRIQDEGTLHAFPGLYIPAFPPFVPDPINVPSITILGNSRLEAQKQDSVELGYRFRPIQNMHVDVTGFYAFTDDRVSVDIYSYLPGFPDALAIAFDNVQTARVRGVEMAMLWQVLDRWQLHANYSYLHLTARDHSNLSSLAMPAIFPDSAKSTPTHQAKVRSVVELPFNLEFDSSFYYASHLNHISTSGETISGYTRFDFRLAWKPIENLELAAVMLNAFDKAHDEQFAIASGRVVPTDVARSYYGSVTWTF